MMDSFFMEVLWSLQTHTRRASKDENTLRNRQLINKYCEEFCQLYCYQLITILGIASNLEAYIARQILTVYINNAEMRSGTHLRSHLNIFFDVQALRSTLRRQSTMTADKQLARAYLADISSFKMILSSTECYDALEGRVNEIQALVRNILMHSYFLCPGWRLSVVGHIEKPLFGMSFRQQSQYTYCMNSPNSMQCSPR